MINLKSYFTESPTELKKVGMVLPLVKLSTLAFRSISKPFANKLKKQAGRHAKFRQFIIGLAQANHRLTTRIQRRIYGHATDVAIRPLNEEKAVQAASELLGEAFLFVVAGAAIIFEVHRNAKKEELVKQRVEGIPAKSGKRVLEKDRKKQEELVKVAELHKQRHELLAIEVELLKSKVAELEKLANSRGYFGFFHFNKSQTEGANAANAA